MYSKYLGINKNFQTSVNLQLDINNEEKIKEYIPTSDICRVLKEYFQIFLGKKSSRSIFLVGPYGKGKSFLLLVLIYLTSSDPKSSTYKSLVGKIRKLDSELSDLISEFNTKKMRLLPVIIISDFKDLNQAFRIALDEALNSHNLQGLIPNSVYRLCLNLLLRWESGKEISSSRLNECLSKAKINLSELKTGLLNYSSKAYEDFKTLYRCTTMGIEFNPLINDNLNEVYSSTVDALSSVGYSGIFLVFDEFSKFLENSTELSLNLKSVQDFAELANHTATDKQITFCCVTHKSLDLYSSEKEKALKDSLKTVEGRFKEIRFNRSLEENYQIISGAITHKGSKEELDQHFEANKGFYKRIKESGIFRPDTDFASLFKGCFPLNPLTTLSLIQLSEIVAQNERTLFTFLSDTDENSFSSFLLKHDSGTLNNDALYDYFNEQLEKDDSEYIRNCWFKAEAALKTIQSPLQRRIIKSLSVIYVINDFGKLAPRADVIALSLNEEESTVNNQIEELIENHYLKKSPINDFLSIASSYNRAIYEKVNLILKSKLKNKSLSQLAEEVNEERYYVPRKYNAENFITRYFRICFLTEQEYFGLNSFGSLLNAEFCDGLIINLIPNDFINPPKLEKVSEKLISIHDSRIVVRLPTPGLDNYFFEELKKISALEELKHEDDLVNNTVTSAEINLLLEDAKREINELIQVHYSMKSPFATCYRAKGEFSDAITEALEKMFPKSIIFNNELVNRNQLSVQYQKSVNNVVDWVLDGEKDDFRYSPTSPEQTIRNSVLSKLDTALNNTNSENGNDLLNLTEVLKVLKEKFTKAPKGGVPVSEFSAILSGAPYGIRKGIHSLILAKIITSLSQSNVVLKFESREIDLNAENLVKAIYSTKSYSFFYSRSSKDQKRYLDSLLTLFNVQSVNNFRKDVSSVAEQMQRFFVSLPKIIRNDKPGKDFLGFNDSILSYKDLFLQFNINPYEMVLEKPLDTFDKSYGISISEITSFVKEYQKKFKEYKRKIQNVIRKEFSISPATNLKTGIDNWIKHETKTGCQLVLSNSEDRIYTCIQDMKYNDEDNADAIAFATLGTYPEDWEKDELNTLSQRLEKFKEELKSAEAVDMSDKNLEKAIADVDDNFSTMGAMLKNNIKSNLTEYGDSVEKTEKLKILLSLVKELMK